MKVMVTGGSGLVGSNIISKLNEEKEFTLLAPSHSECDLRNYENVLDYVTENKPEMIIHCAGTVGGIQANIKEPVRFLVENTDMGRNIVLAAKNADIPGLINMGSSCMYPRFAKNPLKEEDIANGELEPTNEGYAIAKIYTQRLCDYVRKENPLLNYKTVIPCNLYGIGDKFDLERAHLLPSIIVKIDNAIKNNMNSVEIWGDGKARREFMFAEDLADFVLYAIKNFKTMPSLLNVGLGFDYTITEYYLAVAKVLGYKGTFTYDTQKPAGMKQKLVDTTKLNSFGWKASTSLEEGIKKTYEYYLNSK